MNGVGVALAAADAVGSGRTRKLSDSVAIGGRFLGAGAAIGLGVATGKAA